MTNVQVFLLDQLLGKLVQLISEKRGIDMSSALDVVYHSPIYDKIMNIETGLYLQSEDYIYEMM